MPIQLLANSCLTARKGTPKATNGLEQCGWSAKTGKFYQNVPVDGAGRGGAVAVIDPKTMKVEETLPGSDRGLRPPARHGHRSAEPDPARLQRTVAQWSIGIPVIIRRTGAVLAVFPDLGGADEVWFNRGRRPLLHPDLQHSMPHPPVLTTGDGGTRDRRLERNSS